MLALLAVVVAPGAGCDGGGGDGDADGDVDSDVDSDADGDADGASPCDPDPCVHGECVADGEGASCECEAGWTGELCELADPCAGFGCENGGTCVADGGGGARCDCPAGFEGERCETDVDECAESPCLNGGTCVDGAGGFVCDCSTAPGWQGDLCDEDFPNCASGPCEHGTCTEGEPGTGEYACECDEGWEGPNCTCETGSGGEGCEEPPATTRCVLTYDLVAGNGDNGTAYTGSNIRIRDTFLGIGDGTFAVGPGTLILRVPSDGGTAPAPGAAEVLYFELAQEFTTVASRITIATDVDAFSPTLGARDNAVAQATGVLSLGASPTLVWGACSYPAGYNDRPSSFTPDVVGTGAGCLAPYRSVGTVHCLDESPLASCSSGGLRDGDNPQDETWEQALQTLTFAAGMASFSMPFALVPNRSESRTSLSLAGTLVSTVCD